MEYASKSTYSDGTSYVSFNSLSLADSLDAPLRPKWVTPSELMTSLGVDVELITQTDKNLWASIEAATPKKGIEVRYTKSNQPVLKFDADSPLPSLLMEALTNVGNLGARCKLAGIIDPSARTILLIRLLKDIYRSAAPLTPGEADPLKSALVGSCKYIIKKTSELSLSIKVDVSKEDVFTLVNLCPSDLKGHVVGAGVLALLPIGRDTCVNLLSSTMTSEERSAAFAIAVETAHSQPKLMGDLNKLHTKLNTKFPIIADELALAINNSYEQAAAYSAVESSAVDWDAIIANYAKANDKSLQELGECELAIAAALKKEKGLTIKQLHQLAGAVEALIQTGNGDKMILARILGARLLEAVPYMNAPPQPEEFDRIVSIDRTYPWVLDDKLKLSIKSFCFFEAPDKRLSFLEAAQRRAQEADFPLDFTGAIPKCLPGLGFKSDGERFHAFTGALNNPKLSGATLVPTLRKMGWPDDSSFLSSVAEFGNLLRDEKYEKAEKVLKDLVDPMFLKVATARLQVLKEAKSNAKWWQ